MLLLPLNILSEITRTFSLMVRLFGNIMSHELVLGVVVALAGLLVPMPLMLLGRPHRDRAGLHLLDPGDGLHRRRSRNPHSQSQEIVMTIQELSILGAVTAVSFGAIGPALAEGRALAAAMESIARQPESADTLSRTLFVGLAMIETMAIYCLVVALLLIFANPYAR